MDISRSSYDVSVRNQVFVEGYKATAIKQVNPYMREIDKYIRGRLQYSDLTTYSRKRLEALLAGVDEFMQGQFSAYTKNLRKDLRQFGVSQSRMEGDSLTRAVTNPAFSATVPASPQVTAAIAATPLSVTGPQGGQLLAPFVRDWSARQRKTVTGAIRQGAFEGQTNQQIINRLRGPRSKSGKYPGGVYGQTYRQTEAMVRTAVQHVSSVARAITMKANNDLVRQYRWLVTLDSRTCATCASLSNQTWVLGEGPVPPAHPNCRCTMVPVLNEQFDFLKQGRTQSSEFGYTDGNDTYYSWLKKQPAAFQDQAIGPTYGKLLRNGGMNANQFADARLSKTFRPLTLAEMEAKNPMLFKNAGVRISDQGMPTN